MASTHLCTLAFIFPVLAIPKLYFLKNRPLVSCLLQIFLYVESFQPNDTLAMLYIFIQHCTQNYLDSLLYNNIMFSNPRFPLKLTLFEKTWNRTLNLVNEILSLDMDILSDSS